MKYRALVSFSGVVTMRKGEEKELKNSWVVRDLLQAKYIEPAEKAEPPKEVKKAKRKTSK